MPAHDPRPSRAWASVAALLLSMPLAQGITCTTSVPPYGACNPDIGHCCQPGWFCKQQLTVSWRYWGTKIGQKPLELARPDHAVSECRQPTNVVGRKRRRALLMEDSSASLAPRQLLQGTSSAVNTSGVCGSGYVPAVHNSHLINAETCTANDDCPTNQGCWLTSGDMPRICSQSFYSTAVDVSAFCTTPAECQARLAVTVCYPHQPEMCFMRQDHYLGAYDNNLTWFDNHTPDNSTFVDRVLYTVVLLGQHVSLRWTSQIRPLVSGVYTFEHYLDHVSDVYVDDVHVLSNTGSDPGIPALGSITLAANRTYKLTMMYGSSVGISYRRLRWAGPDGHFQDSFEPLLVCSGCPIGVDCGGRCLFSQQWFSGYHYDDLSFFTTNSPYANVSTADVHLDFTSFEYFLNSPPQESVRASGLLKLPSSGNYTFQLVSDDDGFVFIDNQLVWFGGVAQGRTQGSPVFLGASTTHWMDVFWGNWGYSGSLSVEWALVQQKTTFSSDFTSLLACPSLAGCPAGFTQTADLQCAPDPARNPCAPGSFSIDGGAPCTPCPAGFFAALPASTSCVPCQRGTYSGQGARFCKRLPYVYGACYADRPPPNRVLPFMNFRSNKMTVELCLQRAQRMGYLYAGVQYGFLCFGGHSLPPIADASNDSPLWPGLCLDKCAGRDGNKCGGTFASNIYIVPPLLPSGNVTFFSGACYADYPAPLSVLPVKLYSGTNLTLAYCASLALQNGFGFFGVEAGDLCFAGNDVPPSLQQGNCTTQCAGGDRQICGGAAAINIYEV